jgi:hypothetical protein
MAMNGSACRSIGQRRAAFLIELLYNIMRHEYFCRGHAYTGQVHPKQQNRLEKLKIFP